MKRKRSSKRKNKIKQRQNGHQTTLRTVKLFDILLCPNTVFVGHPMGKNVLSEGVL